VLLGDRRRGKPFRGVAGRPFGNAGGTRGRMRTVARRWRQAAGGDGRLVLLTGEPGIGKSRLVATLTEEIKGGPHGLIRFLCSPRRSYSTLFPVVALLERALAFASDETPTEKLAKLEVSCATSGLADAEAVALIGPSAGAACRRSLPGSGTQPAKSARRRPLRCGWIGLRAWPNRSRSSSCLRTCIGSTLPRLRSVHWWPRASLASRYCCWSPRARNSRRLGRANAHVTSLALTRLRQSDVTALMAQISGEKILPPDVRGSNRRARRWRAALRRRADEIRARKRRAPIEERCRPACRIRSWRGSTGSASRERVSRNSAPPPRALSSRMS